MAGTGCVTRYDPDQGVRFVTYGRLGLWERTARAKGPL